MRERTLTEGGLVEDRLDGGVLAVEAQVFAAGLVGGDDEDALVYADAEQVAGGLAG